MFKNETSESLDRYIKAADLAERLQRVALQRDIGIQSRARAAATVAIAQVQADQATRQDSATKANDIYHNRYYFSDPVVADSVQTCMQVLTVWHRLNANSDIEIVFTCNGGDVVQGFALFDFIRQLSRKGHTITTSVLGGAFSMAAMLLQAGDHRNMGKESWLMFHAGDGGFQGTAGQVQDMADWSKRMGDQIVNIIYERSKGIGTDLTREKLTQQILDNRRDWWVSSDEALKLGLVDAIL